MSIPTAAEAAAYRAADRAADDLARARAQLNEARRSQNISADASARYVAHWQSEVDNATAALLAARAVVREVTA